MSMHKMPRSTKAFDALLSIAQVAEIKGVSTAAVYLALKEGRVAGLRIGSHWVLERRAVGAWKVRPK